MLNTQALIGTMLGTCTIQKCIGRGEMGAVFLAQQSRPHRQVAVKVLLPGASLTSNQWPAYLERFHREISAVSSLKQQNILPVFEYGEQNGLAYLVMPYIRGGTLGNVIERESSLPLSRIVDYLEQLATALDFAHERSILHQDMRPANILVAPEGYLLLTDFGIVKLLGENEVLRIRLLKSGASLDALNYMAPEQVTGESIGVQTDLYALGIILYQMVTGKTPFVGETAKQMATQLVQAAPPSPRLWRANLPDAAEQAMLRAIAKRPADRYTRAQDFARAFRAALTAAGMKLESSQSETPASDRSASAYLAAPRSGSLFDPTWQKTKEEVMTPVGGISAASNNGRSRNKTAGLSSSIRKTPLVPTAEAASSVGEQKAKELAVGQPTERNTPSSPERPRLGRKTSFLRPMDEATTTSSGSTTRTSSGTSSVADRELAFLPGISSAPAPTVPDPISPFPAGNVTRVLPRPQSDTGSYDNTDALPTGKRVVPDPVSPFPSLYTTGALMLPGSEEGKPGTIKLTGAVKVVQVPVAGQPGRYVTGLLPVLPPGFSMQQLEEPLLTTKIAARLNDIKKQQKVAALAILMLLVLAVSTFLFFYTRPGPATKAGIQAEHVVPNLQAILAARATATATANTILIDPLTQNIHNWPLATTGSRIYVFKDGAYHITNNDAAISSPESAPAILPDVVLKGPMAYTLTMEEIRGNDSSLNNSFGMILYFNSQTRGGRDIVTFYSFEVVNNAAGEYQFWKYDNSRGPTANPWTSIWHRSVGGEFHKGHGPKSMNTFKVFVSGKYFTFTVNGRKVGTAENSSLSSGEVGMLVNLKGTEVAFSDLKLTYT